MKTLTIIELKNLTTEEFAEKIKLDPEQVKVWIKDTCTMSYTNTPKQNVGDYVDKLRIPVDVKENVFRFLWVGLYNHPIIPFYNGRGWGTTLRTN